ncbi:MAG: DNA repair protein RecN [Chloroflexi bacterium]|nr:DNA repair protein RecN [Chloroflexota bacterium]
MLAELDITNFAIIDHLHLNLAGGLTVLTGETGAGKSIIIDALGVLLGGHASSDLIREGASSARVEGVFTVGPSSVIIALLSELGLSDEEGVLILSRELVRSGRGSIRANGRAIPLSTLQQLGGFLVDIHGQTDHLALLRPADQLNILDRYAHLTPQREALELLVHQLRTLRAEIAELSQNEREVARRIDLLQFQIDEIAKAAPQPQEEQELEDRIRMLSNAERLRELTTHIMTALAGDGPRHPSTEELLGGAARSIDELAQLDRSQHEIAVRLTALLSEVQEINRDLRHYLENVESDPQSLQLAIERQELLRSLKRKYGTTLAEVIAYRDEAVAELAALQHRDERRSQLSVKEQRLTRQVAQAATALSQLRRAAAERLAARVQREIHTLNMHGARFTVQIQQRPHPHGLPFPAPDDAIESLHEQSLVAFDRSGVDIVEFLVSPNLGESPKSVTRIASGGETSRIMLALKSALAEADATATLVFDEVDTGVGGRSGQVIGEKLWSLARFHQVLCITHLPQVAAYGDQHLQIRKAERDGRTTTAIVQLTTGTRDEEIAQMLGGAALSDSTRRAAQDLLSHATFRKQEGLPHDA